MSKIIYEASAIADVYKDKATGEERKRWVKCGVVMETSSGGMALKLESLPVKFDGWLQFYVPKPKDTTQPVSYTFLLRHNKVQVKMMMYHFK